MQGPAGSNPPELSFLEFVFHSLPFQIKKFDPGYPQIPKHFFLKKVRFKNKKSSPPPHEKLTVS